MVLHILTPVSCNLVGTFYSASHVTPVLHMPFSELFHVCNTCSTDVKRAVLSYEINMCSSHTLHMCKALHKANECFFCGLSDVL